jgi:hypothetical protein
MCSQGFGSIDGNTWSPLAAATLAMPASVYFGMAVASASTSQTSVQFRDIESSTNGVIGPVALNSEPLGPSSRRTGLVISEIMYNPRPLAGTNSTLEFIELYNSQPFSENLTGFRLSGDIDYAFPNGTVLRAGAFLVVARDPASVQSHYGISGVLGPYTNNLPNDKGTIRLRGLGNNVVLEANYEGKFPWPLRRMGRGIRWFSRARHTAKRIVKRGLPARTSAGRPERSIPSPRLSRRATS